MFGKPNNAGEVGGNRLVFETNIRSSKDLDLPLSFVKSNRNYIVSKKKEKERRIHEKLKNSKLKIISYYILQYKSYKLARRECSNAMECLFARSQHLEKINLDLLIRLFRFTMGATSGNIAKDFEKFDHIMKILNEDFGKASREISPSNLLFLFRNGLTLLFLENQSEALKINKSLIKNVVDQILYLFFSRPETGYQKKVASSSESTIFKRRDLIYMVFNYSMIDLFFLRYFELMILNRDIEAGIMAEIFDEVFKLCTSKASRDYAQCSYYMGRNLINIPKTDDLLLKKARELSRKNPRNQIETFFKNRYLWIMACCFSIIFKSRHALDKSQIKALFENYLSLLDFESLQSWIVNENQDSIRMIKNPFQQLPANSPFSLLLLNYSLLDGQAFTAASSLKDFSNTLFKFTKLQDFKSKDEPKQREFIKEVESSLLSVYYFVNSWDFFPNVLQTDMAENIRPCNFIETYSNREEIIQMINFIFEVISQGNNKKETHRGDSFEEKLKLLYLVRLFILFLDIEGKLLLLGTYIQHSDVLKDRKMLLEINEQLKENQLLSKNTIYQIIQPILTLALDFSCRDGTTIQYAVNIINLMNDIYFPLYQVPNIVIENIYYYNHEFSKEKITYLHNALDLCNDKLEMNQEESHLSDKNHCDAAPDSTCSSSSVLNNSNKSAVTFFHSFLRNQRDRLPPIDNSIILENIDFLKKMEFLFLISKSRENDTTKFGTDGSKTTSTTNISKVDTGYNVDKLSKTNKNLQRVVFKTLDHEFLEKSYRNDLCLNSYFSFDNFCNLVTKSKLKLFQERQILVLDHLCYDTCWVLLLFLCIHNIIIFNYGGNIHSFLLDATKNASKRECDFLNILTLFGISLNHQLLFLDDYEVKACIRIMQSHNSTIGLENSSKYAELPNTEELIFPFLNASEMVVTTYSNEVPTTIITSGSEMLERIMINLAKNYKSLSHIITYRNIQNLSSIQDDSITFFFNVNDQKLATSCFSTHPILLINNKSQLNYISLFINNLTFSMLKMTLERKCNDVKSEIMTNMDDKCYINRSGNNGFAISVFGELTRRLYQYYLKLNHFQMKLDDPKAKLPWTISEASNLLKPRDVLIKQALHIESLGYFPGNNSRVFSTRRQSSIRERNGNRTRSRIQIRGRNNYEDSSFDHGQFEDGSIIHNSSNSGNDSDYNSDYDYDYDEDYDEYDGNYNNGEKIQARLNLLMVFDSTLRYVSNKSKFRLLRQILREMPYLIGFEERLHFYYHYIAEHKFNHYQPSSFNEIPNFDIRRANLIEDGLNNIGNLDPNRLRMAFKIRFVDENGEVEPGIDGGGLLKDFITSISRELCSESFGLFKTCKDNTIAPREFDVLMNSPDKFNDLVMKMVNKQQLNQKNTKIILYLFEFLGRIVGKAIYEKILLEIEFNPVFLNSVFGQKNDFTDLLNLDQELCKSLNYIKNLDDQEMNSLCLTFSITLDLESASTDQHGGGHSSPSGHSKHLEVDLIPNGRNITVNNDNKIVYIKLLTHYKLITSIKLQAEAFLRGLSAVIPNESLRLFSPYELQSLISGEYKSLDVDNLRLNTCYNGYLETSQPILWLWDILKNEFSVEEQAEFLLFVTSSRKAPLLGFQHLNPKFGIQIVPDKTRLPTASTCFNLLKLPAYDSKEILKLKLKQAIFNSKGFDLS